MKFEFDSEIMRLEGKIKWSVFYFPYSAIEHLGSKGNIPVSITVDGHEFEHTLLPSKNGHYLVFNEFIKRATGKKFGDVVHVTLEMSGGKHEFVVSGYIEEYLRSAGVWELFDGQADYSKREQANHIELAKKEETRENRLKKLAEQLIREQYK